MSITYTTARRKKICDYALKYGKMKAPELYGVSRPSIDRWLKRYDRSKASLADYSRRPKSHPNQSTPEEIKKIQTDNGIEFTNRYVNTKALSALDVYLATEGIEHQLTLPATPWHNGRVERSHRTDDKFFYSKLQFYDLNDLREQGKKWLRRYQNIYQRKYKYLSPIEVWKEYKLTGKHPIYHI